MAINRHLADLEAAIFSEPAQHSDLYGESKEMKGGQKEYRQAPAFLQAQNYLYGKMGPDGAAIESRLHISKPLLSEIKNINFPLYYSASGQITKNAVGTLAEINKKSESKHRSELNKNMSTYALQIIEQIYQLHAKGLVHRDITLSNIFIYDNPAYKDTPENIEPKFILKVSDLDTTSAAKDDIYISTEGYVAPELMTYGVTGADPIKLNMLTAQQRMEVDAHSLGITLKQFAEIGNKPGTVYANPKNNHLKEVIESLLKDKPKRMSVEQAFVKLGGQIEKKEDKKSEVSSSSTTTNTSLGEWVKQGISFVASIVLPTNRVPFTSTTTSPESKPLTEISQLEDKKPAVKVDMDDTPKIISLLKKTKEFYNDIQPNLLKSQALYDLHHQQILELYKFIYRKPPPNEKDKKACENIIKASKDIQLSISSRLTGSNELKLENKDLSKIIENAMEEYKAANDIVGSKEEGKHGRRVWGFFSGQIWGGIRNAEELHKKCKEKSDFGIKDILDHIESGPGQTAPTSFRTILKRHVEAYTGTKCEELSNQLKSKPSLT